MVALCFHGALCDHLNGLGLLAHRKRWVPSTEMITDCVIA